MKQYRLAQQEARSSLHTAVTLACQLSCCHKASLLGPGTYSIGSAWEFARNGASEVPLERGGLAWALPSSQALAPFTKLSLLKGVAVTWSLGGCR